MILADGWVEYVAPVDDTPRTRMQLGMWRVKMEYQVIGLF
jgi:hypothetical protein